MTEAVNVTPKWVPLLKQPNLPHQFDLVWLMPHRLNVKPVCNCGTWEGTAYPPDRDGGFDVARDEYQDHLAAVLPLQLALA